MARSGSAELYFQAIWTSSATYVRTATVLYLQIRRVL